MVFVCTVYGGIVLGLCSVSVETVAIYVALS